LCASACKRESTAAKDEPSARQAIARGEFVIVERAAAVFEQTRVLEVAPRRLRVDSGGAGDSDESTWIPSADVYILGRTWSPPAGAFAVCQQRASWLPCKVEQAAGPSVRARDAHGKPLELAIEQVIEPRAVTELNLRRHFEQAAERDAFLAGYARAGKPRRTRGWLPGPRSRVIAERQGEWFSARIHEFDEEVPRVSFELDGRITELSVSELAPEPPYELGGLRRGDFVLRRPPGPTQAWKPVQVRALGEQELRVADVSGELATVSIRDVVPLSADR
jgi:hypothetical protein